ncbi:MAG: 23S rRNA (guanosine(2251)-2'-O)-methyltransferase RlmB [Deltaproteobacteria bacterium]|nr:23S rRNA (guanosine(2251)-2'-O)-methyltransferase RlmB [Deltaproteobacteria bacterium]
MRRSIREKNSSGEEGQWICGIHPLLEALSSQSSSLDKIYMVQGHWGRALREVAALAKERRIPMVRTPREALDRLVEGKGHQGVVGRKGAVSYLPLESILDSAVGPKPGVVAFFYHVQDPQNLGAALRSARIFGIQGVVLEEEHSASITPAVIKASAGMALEVPVARIPNFMEGLEKAKERDFSLFAATLDGKPLGEVPVKRPMALVFGSEGEGLPDRVVQKCDEEISIPMALSGVSLNLSVAAGIFFFWCSRKGSLKIT